MLSEIGIVKTFTQTIMTAVHLPHSSVWRRDTGTMCAAASKRVDLQSQDLLSEWITRRCFYLLILQEDKPSRQLLRVGNSFKSLTCTDEHQLMIVEAVTERILKLMHLSPQPQPWRASDFTANGTWEITATNLHSEFSRVAEVMFADEVSWGRIVAFLGFSVGYALYAVEKGLQVSVVESVCAWTVQVLQDRLHIWLQEHSWDSFVNYAETILNKKNGVLVGQQPAVVVDSLWKVGMTVGAAVGLGAMLAFSVKNALS